MQPTICSRCKKNVAVVFITKIENGHTVNEGLCLKCAKELGIKPVEDMMQRMGIRAPILLLDECTSALDAETEQKVLERIRSLPDRTCIAVTHRTAAMEIADWRLEVENGKINAKPSH